MSLARKMRVLSDQTAVDRRNATGDAFVFARDAWLWVVSAEGRLGLDGEPRPGTWCPPVEGFPATCLAAVCCPKCGKISVLDSRVHAIGVESQVIPDFRCKIRVGPRDCGYASRAHLDRWGDKVLYAAAIETWVPHAVGRPAHWAPSIVHCHAKDEAEARMHIGPGNYRVVAVAPAIGALAADEHGEKLVGNVERRAT